MLKRDQHTDWVTENDPNSPDLLRQKAMYQSASIRADIAIALTFLQIALIDGKGRDAAKEKARRTVDAVHRLLPLIEGFLETEAKELIRASLVELESALTTFDPRQPPESWVRKGFATQELTSRWLSIQFDSPAQAGKQAASSATSASAYFHFPFPRIKLLLFWENQGPSGVWPAFSWGLNTRHWTVPIGIVFAGAISWYSHPSTKRKVSTSRSFDSSYGKNWRGPPAKGMSVTW
jgi:hypothetical protein